jgi:hypothetical protein
MVDERKQAKPARKYPAQLTVSSDEVSKERLIMLLEPTLHTIRQTAVVLNRVLDVSIS